MNFIKKILQERRDKKSIEDLHRKFDEWKNRNNRIAECGGIYDANDEQPLINRLDAIFDKHHGW